MTRIALITYSAAPGFDPDDLALVEELQAESLEVNAVPWDSAEARWSDYELAVVRSTWDYHERIAEFVSWLASFPVAECKLFNDSETLLWNSHKFYLQDLESSGVKILETAFLSRGSKLLPKQIAVENNWEAFVVKPAVSAAARDTYLSSSSDYSPERVSALLKSQDLLVQRFYPELPLNGELSFVFFNSEFSYLIRSKAAPGDFRVQGQYHGTSRLDSVCESLVEQAKEVLVQASRDTLYARVDGVEIDGQFLLSELELIEPGLSLRKSQGGAKHFSRAILERL